MKKLLTLLLILTVISAQSQFSKYFHNRTLRIDYFHSGSEEVEYYLPDEMILEGKWAGPRENLINPFDYGNYKIMVYDSASNELIYGYSYSTLFYEYRSTETAKTTCGNFSESVVMPYPKYKARVEFYSRDKEMVWSKQYEMMVDPEDPYIRVTESDTYPVERIARGGNPKRNLDIVFLPEGYTAGQMGKFLSDCDRFRDYLFETSPYSENIKKINIWAVMAPSQEEGTDFPSKNIMVNTLLNSNFETFETERYLTTSDYKSVLNVSSNAPCDAIVILVNNPLYGGGGIYNFYAITTVDDDNSGFVFTHEFGHSLAGLGDEYYTSDVAVQDFYALDKEPAEPNLTTLVDFRSKWLDMMDPSTPIPTPATKEYHDKVGVFEGGGYMRKGIYRPYEDCSMNAVKFNNFCPVCKRAIRSIIEYYSR